MRVEDRAQATTRVRRPPWLDEPEVAAPLDAQADLLANLGAESVLLNLEGALKVRARHELLIWTQGALQNLIPHELLICALCHDRPVLRYVDSFSTAPIEASLFNELFRNDVSLVPAIFRAWEENHCQPVTFETGSGSQHGSGGLARALARLGAGDIIAHGTHDTSGQIASLFAFARKPGAADSRQARIVELVVPFLHAAWLRAQVNWQAQERGVVKPAEAGLITVREREVLEWIYRGKSNIEIGMILGISPLTVKNHVQKILRKLNVLNRTQAVGKALALRILST